MPEKATGLVLVRDEIGGTVPVTVRRAISTGRKVSGHRRATNKPS